MKKIAVIMIVFVWFFAHWDYYGIDTVGPFNSQKECIEIRQKIFGDPNLNETVKIIGGFITRCWRVDL